MNRYHVTYYYLATGMEGRADQQDYGYVNAESADEAKRIVIEREWPTIPKQDKEWTMGALRAVLA